MNESAVTRGELRYEGKAKRVYATPDPQQYIVEYKDDATAFNGVKKAQIAGKGAIAGFVLYWLVHDELHILNVACAPERRRQGVARRLLVEAEARALAANIAVLVLEVRRSNTAAQELYTGLGHNPCAVRRVGVSDPA